MHSFPEEWQLLNKQTKIIITNKVMVQLSNRYLVTVAITMKLFSTKMIKQQQHTHRVQEQPRTSHHWTLPYKATLQSHYIIYFKNNNWWTHTHTGTPTPLASNSWTALLLLFTTITIQLLLIIRRHIIISHLGYMFQWLMGTELHYYSIITTTHTHTTNYYYHITTTASSSIHTHTQYSLRASR